MSRILERELKAREILEKAFEGVCPNVLKNPYIPHFPLPTQAIFLGMHQSERWRGRVFRALYGGAAGGGKSEALLMGAAQYAWKYSEFAGIVFRRTYTDLAQPGALMDRALEWWLPRRVAWDGTNKIFRFPSGAKVAMAYLKGPNDHLRYQSAAYHYTAWDELTQWGTPRQYEYVGLSRVRRLEGSTIPLRTLAASNPGGPGHIWVMRMFVGGVDPVTGEEIKPEYPYVPARIEDNPFLDKGAYIESLSRLHPTVRDQLLKGDWHAREPGDYFRSEWFGPLLDPEENCFDDSECVRVRWWDLAASERPDAKRTAGVLMARHINGVRVIEHAVAFRATPGKRDDLIVKQARIDGPNVYVGIEIEPGSGGLAQFYALEKRLKGLGFKVVGAKPREQLKDERDAYLMREPNTLAAKAARADPVASCLERGYQRRGECPDTGSPWWGLDRGKALREQRDGIRLFYGPWVRDYLTELESFPDIDLCDYVDATSGAWAWLEIHGKRLQKPPVVPKKQKVGKNQFDMHPEEREELKKRERLYKPL